MFEIIRRPIVTEKGLAGKENHRTLCLEVHREATKTDIKTAVEKIFKVKVEGVRTANFQGKERRRGKYAGYRPDWKKAYVKLKEGEKMVEYAAHV
jgi:large subunit ribosomal protein L23